MRVSAASLRLLQGIKIALVTEGRPFYGPMFTIDIADAVKDINVDGETLNIEIREPAVKKKNDLVGYGGLYVHPKLADSPDARSVISYWNWFDGRVHGALAAKVPILAATWLLQGLFGWGYTFRPALLLSAARDAYAVRNISGFDEKILELERQLSGTNHGPQLMDRIESAGAEFRTARLYADLGRNVIFGRTPDLTVDRVPVEVKMPRSPDERAVYAATDKAFTRQHAQIVIIDNSWVFHNRLFDVSKDHRWALRKALKYAGRGKRTALRLSYSNLYGRAVADLIAM